jgi:AhpC/TSA antioxidant enzyme
LLFIVLLAVLCREEAIHLWNERQKFESLGIRMVCILHEWRDKEVEAFHPAYWGGELYFDEAKNFHAAVHGGKIKRGNVLDLLNPFSRAWKNMRRARESNTVKDSNLLGDGLTMGGVMIVSTAGKIEYAFPEATFGDHAPFEELLAAAKKAAGK